MTLGLIANLPPLFAGIAALAAMSLALVLRLLSILLPVVCIVHVIRARRDFWWIFLILFVPLIGPLVYFFVEMYPSLRSRRFGKSPYAGGSARRRIRQLEELIPYSDTVDNRSELGIAYCEIGEFAKAKAAFEHCLQGIYKDDPHLLHGLAKACFGLGEHAEALHAVEKSLKSQTPDYINERRLLRAKALEALGRAEEALQAYAEVAPRLSGLEGRFLHGSLLRRLGNTAEAKQAFERILSEARHMGSAARRREKTWLQRTRQELAEMAEPHPR